MFEEQRIRLNSLPQVDYEEVNKQKRSYLRMLFEQESENILTSESFEAFFRDNKEWLIPYAAYSYLRDLNHTSDFNNWGEYSRYEQRTNPGVM